LTPNINHHTLPVTTSSRLVTTSRQPFSVMSGHSSQTLVHLLSSTPYTLAYSLPLLCLSLILTFAGTFLMLDRSRSFPPSADYDTLPGVFEKSRKHKFVWYWEGGIGGLTCGFTTGRKPAFADYAHFGLTIVLGSASGHLPIPPHPFNNLIRSSLAKVLFGSLDSCLYFYNLTCRSLSLCCFNYEWIFWRVSGI